MAAIIDIVQEGKQVLVRPHSHLSKARFNDYLIVCSEVNAIPEDTARTHVLDSIKDVPLVTCLLRRDGFLVNIQESITDQLRHVKRPGNSTREVEERAQYLADHGLPLRPFQLFGAKWLAPMDRALLADDMGLGKTVQAAVAIPEGAPVLVVCPASVKYNWALELAKWRGFKATVLAGRNSFRWPEEGEVLIVNYDILPQSIPQNVSPGTIVIADEAHSVKNRNSLRAQRFTAIASLCQQAKGKVWLLTATPIMNNPLELWSVLEAMNAAHLVFGSFLRFYNLFHAHKVFVGTKVVDENGEEKEKRIYTTQWGDADPKVPQLLKSIMLRRTKVQVLTDLPDITERNITVATNTHASRAADVALAALPPGFWEQVEESVQSTAKGGAGFEELSHARMLLAASKIPALVELVESYENANEPLVVFSAYKKPVHVLGARDGWGELTGDTSPEERQRVVEDFQAGKLKGLATTIKAGGVGITLTRASHVIFNDLEWNPALNAQARDRVYRIGQKRGVLVTYLVANHALDKRLSSILGSKLKLVNDTLNESAEDLRGSFHEEAIQAAVEQVRKTIPRRSPRVNDARHGPQTSRERWAARAILVLSKLDLDNCTERNDVGWNAYDTHFGKSLAGDLIRTGKLTNNQWKAAIKVCKKYHRQIGECPEG